MRGAGSRDGCLALGQREVVVDATWRTLEQGFKLRFSCMRRSPGGRELELPILHSPFSRICDIAPESCCSLASLLYMGLLIGSID